MLPIGHGYSAIMNGNNLGTLSGISANKFDYRIADINKTKASGINSNESTGRVSPSECQTCKNRKYVDDSNEGNVSFKTPGHISPSESLAVVSSHEQEHVSNAIREGNEEGKDLVSANVSLKMSICPECGTAYVSGGLTTTTMKVSTSNATPYDSARSLLEGSVLTGMNVDEKV